MVTEITDISQFISQAPTEVQGPEKGRKEVDYKSPFYWISDLQTFCNAWEDYQERFGIEPEIPWFVVDKFIASKDSILLANQMNMHELPSNARYLFYKYTIPKKKVFNKNYKPDKNQKEREQFLMQYYKWGANEAHENYLIMLQMYSDEELDKFFDIETQEALIRNKNGYRKSVGNKRNS